MNETVMTIVGNIASDLTQRRTSTGTKVVNFRVASNERRFDRETGQWQNGDKLSVTCWRKLALGAAVSLAKGDPVIITGRLFQDSYQTDGETKTVLRLEAYAIGPDLSRCTADVRRGPTDPPGTPAPAGDAPETSAASANRFDDWRPALAAVAN